MEYQSLTHKKSQLPAPGLTIQTQFQSRPWLEETEAMDPELDSLDVQAEHPVDKSFEYNLINLPISAHKQAPEERNMTRLDPSKLIVQQLTDISPIDAQTIQVQSADEKGKATVEDIHGVPGTYSTQIQWGIHTIDARPVLGKGFWGKRISQTNPRVEAYELKINPNNESFYVPHPDGGYVQFENLILDSLQDGKLVQKVENSIYHVYDKPEFLRKRILDEAIRQTKAANSQGLKVEWLVSEQRSVDRLTDFFQENNINITVKFLAE